MGSHKCFAAVLASALVLLASCASQSSDIVLISSSGSSSSFSPSAFADYPSPNVAEDPGSPSTDTELDAAAVPLADSSSVSADYELYLTDSGVTTKSENVSFSAGSVTISNPSSDGSMVAYHVTGSLTDGSISVSEESAGPIKLVLDGVTVVSASGPAVSNESGQDLVLFMPEGSVSVITDNQAYDDISKPKKSGAVYSVGNVSFEGKGKISIVSAGTNGIYSKADISVADSSVGMHSYLSGIKAAGKIGITGESSQGIGIETEYEGHGITADGDISISGSPALTIVTVDGDESTLTAGGGAGLKSDADICISGGTIDITTAGGAPSEHYDPDSSIDDVDTKGIRAGDGDTEGTGGNIYVSGGVINISSRDDALHANGYLDTDTLDYEDGNIDITGGTLFISSGDDAVHGDNSVTVSENDAAAYLDIRKAYEGLEGKTVAYEGGTSYIKTSDDALNAASSDITDIRQSYDNYLISISGGYLEVDASGDGLDSNGSILISGGFTVVSGPTDQGNGELDYGDTSGSSFMQTGGVLLAYGSGGQMDRFEVSGSQATAYLGSLSASSSQYIVVADSGDNVLLALKPLKQAASFYVSLPEFAIGNYEVYVASSISGGDELFGQVYVPITSALNYGSYSSSASVSFTASDVHYNSGSSGGFAPGSGPGGGHR